MSDQGLRRRIARLERTVRQRDYHFAEIERRLANVAREGTIHAVDAGARKVRVKIGTDPDGRPVLTPWQPWTERAGVIKTWSPPSVGEQVRVISPSGDIAQGWVELGGFSTANPAPSTDPQAHVMTIGDVVITAKNGLVSIVQGEARVSIADGEITLKGAKITTDGPTHLNKGTVPVHPQGGVDSAGDVAVTGADGVFV